MSLLKKLLKSTAREDFSTMSKSKQLDSVRDDVEKRIASKKINMKGLKRL